MAISAVAVRPAMATIDAFLNTSQFVAGQPSTLSVDGTVTEGGSSHSIGATLVYLRFDPSKVTISNFQAAENGWSSYGYNLDHAAEGWACTVLCNLSDHGDLWGQTATGPMVYFTVTPANSQVDVNDCATLRLSSSESELCDQDYNSVLPTDACGSGTFALQSQVMYVSAASASTAEDGRSWNTAYHDLSTATRAAADGAEIWIAEGTYPGGIVLKQGIHLYGGFSGTEATRGQRDPAVHPTILDGSFQCAVGITLVPQAASAKSSIDGLFLQGFVSTGIDCRGGAVEIRNNTISENGTYGRRDTVGGGVNLVTCSATVQNNVFQGNAAGGGAGLRSYRCQAVSVANNVFRDNVSGQDGGAIESIASQANVTDNLLMNNGAGRYGGAVYYGDTSAGSARISGNTLFGNQSKEGSLFVAGPARPLVSNNIVAYNSSGIAADTSSAVPLPIRYNCLYGNRGYNVKAVGATQFSHNLMVDPLFVNPAGGDFCVRPASRCVDAGDDGIPQPNEVDLDGKSRVLGSHTDIGAYEQTRPVPLGSPISPIRVQALNAR